jgi:hypothetical protein
MNLSDVEKQLKEYRRKIVTDYLEGKGLHVDWAGGLRILINGIHFTFATDYSGIEIDLHGRTTAIIQANPHDWDKEKDLILTLEKVFPRGYVSDFDIIVDRFEKLGGIFSSGKIMKADSKTGIFVESIKKFNEFE